MTDKKLTDNEIIKALECCNKPIGKTECGICPLYHSAGRCTENMLTNALDLINRQKAEIERLYKENDRLSQCVLYHEGDIADAKLDAIEGFANEIEKEISQAIINNGTSIEQRIINQKVDRYEDNFCTYLDGKIMALGSLSYFIKNLVKEMVGEKNG